MNADGKKLKFDDTEVPLILDKFRKALTDKAGRSYIAFAPRTNLTIELMERVLKILMIQNQNQILTLERHSSFGAVSGRRHEGETI